MSPPLVEIENLRVVFYGDAGRVTHAVDGVDLAVPRDIDAAAYAGYPRKRGLEILCAAWAAGGRGRLVIGGLDRDKGLRWLERHSVAEPEGVEWVDLPRPRGNVARRRPVSSGGAGGATWSAYLGLIHTARLQGCGRSCRPPEQFYPSHPAAEVEGRRAHSAKSSRQGPHRSMAGRPVSASVGQLGGAGPHSRVSRARPQSA